LRPQAQRITIHKDGHFAAQPFFIALNHLPQPLLLFPLNPFYPDTFCLLKQTHPGKDVSFRVIMIPYRERKNLPGNQEALQEPSKTSRKFEKHKGIVETLKEIIKA
jgi:hypothetical protein